MDRYDKLEKDNQELRFQLDICRERLRLAELKLEDLSISELNDSNTILDDIEDITSKMLETISSIEEIYFA